MAGICFFVGHRDAAEDLYEVLAQGVRRHVQEYGVAEFIVGNHGNFDHLAAKAVVEIKRDFPAVTLYLLCPYHQILPADPAAGRI